MHAALTGMDKESKLTLESRTAEYALGRETDRDRGEKDDFQIELTRRQSGGSARGAEQTTAARGMGDRRRCRGWGMRHESMREREREREERRMERIDGGGWWEEDDE